MSINAHPTPDIPEQTDTQTGQSSPWIGAQEAADLLQRDRVTAIRYAKSGRIKYQRLTNGGAFMLDRGDVEALSAKINPAAKPKRKRAAKKAQSIPDPED